jgi:DNA-binding transcriptional LysR family regulator
VVNTTRAPLQLFDVRYFLACVDGGSLLAGARRCHVTPAAMTKALRRLEDAMGVSLMARSTRGASLTADGERLVPQLRALLDQADRVQREARGEGAEISGELRVLAMEVFSPVVLPRAIAALVRSHPRLVPKTYESIPERMVELVASGRADVAFTIGRVESFAVSVERLGVTPGILVCGRNHALAKRRAGSRRSGREAVARWPSVVPRFWGAEHLPSIDQFPDDVWPRTVGATIELLRMGVSLVVEGAYLGYFPEIAIQDELAAGALVPLSSPPAAPFELIALTPRAGARAGAALLVAEMKKLLGRRATSTAREG